MNKMNFWHMQMFPDNNFAESDKIPFILEHHKFIGLGDWEEKKDQISDFCHMMQVNDIVAMKKGYQLIALVQIIGGMYEVNNDTELGWIVYRRPVRILDWALNGETLPQPRGTLNRCANDVETTQIIQNWYEKVKQSFEQRNIPILV